jgi:hypothetical protein
VATCPRCERGEAATNQSVHPVCRHQSREEEGTKCCRRGRLFEDGEEDKKKEEEEKEEEEEEYGGAEMQSLVVAGLPSLDLQGEPEMWVAGSRPY